MTEKSTSSSVKCKGFTHCFLRLQWRGASYILAQGRMANKKQYLEVMSRLREEILQKRIELWKNQSWILHNKKTPLRSVNCEGFAHSILRLQWRGGS